MSGSQVNQPDVSITLANADREVSNVAQKVLLVGQMLAAGTASDGVLETNIASTGNPENALFGRSSMLAAMVRAFKLINPLVQVDALPLDDAAGTPRVVFVTFVGTSTEAGTLTINAGSETLHSIDVAIPISTAAAAIPALCVTAINLDLDCPFTAADETGGVLSLTADNDGVVANDLGVETSGTIAGITGMAVTEDTAGATDPTLTGILDVATDRYQAVVWPYAALTVLTTYLDARFNPASVIMDGVGFIAERDSHSDHLTRLGLLNSESIVIFCDKEESETNYLGPSQNEPTYSKAAMFAAVRSLRLTDGASIARYLTSSASLDQFGGAALASLPYFNTPMPDMPVIASGRGWTNTEVEQLLAVGGSVMGVNPAGTSALIGEVKTTYTEDDGAQADPTFGFLNYVDTASGVREYFFNNLKARFAQSRLTEGAVSRGRDMANATIIRAYCEKLYQDLAGASYVLTQDGETAFKFYKTNLVITLTLVTGTVAIQMEVPIVTQLRTITATIRIAFSTEG